MKKILLSLLTILWGVGSMAQSVEIYPSFDVSKQKTQTTLNQPKHPVAIKAPGVTITDVQSGTDPQNGTYVTCVITPNDETVKIASLIQPTGHFEQYIDMGYPIEQIFAQAEQQYNQAGMSLYEDVTPNVPVYKGFSHLTIGNEYTVHVLAFDEQGAFEYTSAVATIEVTGGGEGEASVTITIDNITDSSAKATFEINDQTAYFYLLFGTTDDLESEGVMGVEDFIDNLSVPEVNQYIQKFSSATSSDLAELVKGESYSIVAVAFNANEEAGLGDFKTFIAESNVSLNGVNTIQINVYPNPAKDVVYIESTENITTDVYDVQGKLVVSETKPNATSYILNTASLKDGVYILKVNTDKGVRSEKIVIK